jgi:hypothetical protein
MHVLVRESARLAVYCRYFRHGLVRLPVCRQGRKRDRPSPVLVEEGRPDRVVRIDQLS